MSTDKSGSASRDPESTSSSLLERIKARQPEAWARLVDLYSPLVYRWCRYSGLAPEDARDVVQDVLGAVARSIGDFRGAQAHGSFRAWLRSITRHRVVDHFRSRHGAPEAQGGTQAQLEFLQLADTPEASTATFSPLQDDFPWRRALELVRAEFEDSSWQAFWRVVVDGHKPADVARELGLTIQAVYKAKSRVLRRVRQELADLESDLGGSSP